MGNSTRKRKDKEQHTFGLVWAGRTWRGGLLSERPLLPNIFVGYPEFPPKNINEGKEFVFLDTHAWNARAMKKGR